MNRTARTTVIAAAVVATFGIAAGARAIEQGTTRQDRPFVSGGVSIEEVAKLEANRRDYQLWLVTLDEVSGAWLAGARAVIRDAQGETVLETQLDGPYLFVSLLPGSYAIDVTLEGKTVRRSLRVSGGAVQKLLAHFNTGVEVSPEMPAHPLAKARSPGPDLDAPVR